MAPSLRIERDSWFPWIGESPPRRATGTPPWVEYIPSPYHSSRAGVPVRAVVYHFTAGPRLEGTIRWFQRNDRKVSAHYVIGKDGRTVQMVALDRAAHHAGKGALPGVARVNAASIGIEIVNWGMLTPSGSHFVTHNGKPYVGPPPVQGPDPFGRVRWWEPFAGPQYDALIRLTRDLLGRFPAITHVTGHQDVAVPYGRKNDPGGAFDWQRVRAGLGGFHATIGPLPRGAAGGQRAAPASSSSGPGEANPAFDLTRAVEANRGWGARLGWATQLGAIGTLLGFTDTTPDERRFAQAIAGWQRRNGLGSDGILGPKTWARMRTGLAGLPATGPTTTHPLAPGAGPARLGILTVTAPGFRPVGYRFTPDDATWLGRMLVGEAGGLDTPQNRAVVWAMFNRYALAIRQSAKYFRAYPTFHSFIRAYSTVLQPCLRSKGAAQRHYRSSEYVPCAGAGNYPGTTIPRGQLRKHLAIQKMPWEGLREGARRVVTLAMTGQMASPIGCATEFANTSVYFRQHNGRTPTPAEWRDYTNRFAAGKKWRWIGAVPGLPEEAQRGHNTFFVQLRFAGLPADAVRVLPG